MTRATPSSEPSTGGDHHLHSPLLRPPENNRSDGEGRRERLGVDEVLRKHCGEFGVWQRRHFVLTSLAWALEAFHTMVMIFADRDLDGGDNGSSTAAEWGLKGGEKYKVGMVQAVFFGGCMIGAGVFGHLSDSFLGRKGSLTIVCILNATFGSLTALSPNYWTYSLLRLLTGFSTGGVGLCAFVLATEPVGPSKRGLAGMSTFYFFSAGIALLSGIAYLFTSWRELYVASSIPSLIFVVAVIPFLSESPRWYLVRGRANDAVKVMATIAEANGSHLPDGTQLILDNDSNNSEEEKESSLNESKGGSLVDVVRSRVTRVRLFLAVAINFMCSVVYYGLSLNVVNLDTNLYLNVALNAVAEMPAYTITAVLLDRFGRRPLAIGTMWFSGVFCLLGSMVGGLGAWKVVRMVCGILGIFGMAGNYNLLFIYTTELFPTVVRNAALGCATQASQMGAILAPLVVVLGGGMPFGIFALCGIAGGMLSFYLPETLEKPLYDTMAGMEDAEKEWSRV